MPSASAIAWGLGLHAGGCTCAACAPQPVRLSASIEPVAAPAARTDRYEPSGAAPDDPADTAGDEPATATTDEKPAADATEAGEQPAAPEELNAAEQKMVSDLQRRDREVRAHEAAHQAAGGGIVGGASFTYQSGPDGQRYAIGGEVPVDSSAVPDDPAATIGKMQRVRAAALAPADPSGQDLAVAAAAGQIMVAAQQELTRQRSEETAAKEEEETERQAAEPVEPAADAQEDVADQRPLGVRPDEVSAIIGGQQFRRWIDIAYGQRSDSGSLIDASA